MVGYLPPNTGQFLSSDCLDKFIRMGMRHDRFPISDFVVEHTEGSNYSQIIQDISHKKPI